MKMPHSIALASISLFASTMSIFAQGSLTPPGAPAPTMKTLDQVEARKIVNATNTPGDATNLFIISAAGSYYLTGNITGVSGKNGVQINADNVTLDLNGFALIGVAGSSSGVLVSGTHRNLRIHNGAAQSWGSYGIDCNSASDSQFDHLRVSQNVNGLRCGLGSVVSEISADTNSATGITSSNRSALTACAATNNATGFKLSAYCTIATSTAAGNTSVGFDLGESTTIIGCNASVNSGRGIATFGKCTIKDCVANFNGGIGINSFDSLIVNCTADANGFGIGGNGISGGSGGTVKNCKASNNATAGVSVSGGALVLENNCNNNGGDGILATGDVNRIDGNHTTYNGGVGIRGGFDWIYRNNTGANTGGNLIGSGADIGPLEPASTATHPFANLP